MIDFHRLDPAQKKEYDAVLQNCGRRGCEYSFDNLYLWGRQEAAFLGESLALFSQYDRRSAYPFPILRGDPKPVLDALIDDARSRRISCRFISMMPEDCVLLESLYPGQFLFYTDRDSFDYVYNIDDLADLKGRKYQKKRNHFNHFRQVFPDYRVDPLSKENLDLARELVSCWFARDVCRDEGSEFYQESRAIRRAFDHYDELEMEGLLLTDGGKPLAVTMGSRLTADTFDIHFEKALDSPDGDYAMINRTFARYIREQYPQVQYLDREDDLGLSGLRQAKLSYLPAFLIEKSWARLKEKDWDEND